MRTRRLAVLATAAAGVAIAFAACSETASLPTPPDSLQPSFAKGGTKVVKSIAVTPSSATVNKGATTQLIATASPPGSATTFTWGSSNDAVATVSSTGLVTAVATGSATISASAGGKTGTSAIT